MGSVEVAAISLPRETDRFVRTWFPIYEDDSHWVPPLLFERRRFFDPARNPYFDHADVQCFVARQGDHDVGTIAAVVDHVYQSDEAGTGFFGFFEFVNDPEVATALLDAARHWLAERGMTRALGPFNFNTNHEFGLLVDGFDTDPFVANPHNSAYYPKIYEALGLSPAKDWFAYRLDVDMPGFAKMGRVADRLLSRHPNLRIRSLDPARFDDEVARVHRIYVDAWERNWAHVRVSEAEFRFIAEGLRQILDPDLCLVAEVGDRVAGISVTLPDVNQAVKKMKGGLFPIGWWHWLSRRRAIDRVRIFMLGIAHEFQSWPLGALLYARTFEVGRAKGYRWGEASLILEDNHRMRSALEKMGGTIHKTYRTYEIAIGSPSAPVATP